MENICDTVEQDQVTQLRVTDKQLRAVVAALLWFRSEDNGVLAALEQEGDTDPRDPVVRACMETDRYVGDILSVIASSSTGELTDIIRAHNKF